MAIKVSVFDLCRPEVRSLPKYNAGVSEDVARARYQLTRVTKLASNENLFGSPATVAEEVVKLLGNIYRYPDPNCTARHGTALREQIERNTGVAGARIVIGNGSEDSIEMLCKALLARGDRILQSDCMRWRLCAPMDSESHLHWVISYLSMWVGLVAR